MSASEDAAGLREAILARAEFLEKAAREQPFGSAMPRYAASELRNLAALHSPAEISAEVAVPYLSDRFEWAAPGDQQEDAWIVRFCDQDLREALYTGPDAEREARAAWERHAPGYNMYLFRLARLSPTPAAPVQAEAPSPSNVPETGSIFRDHPAMGFKGLSLASLSTTEASAEHSDDVAVDSFAAAMKIKLAKARDKGRGGWDDPAQCSADRLRTLMYEHLAKGDPVDVANFCMMLAHYGASTATQGSGEGMREELGRIRTSMVLLQQNAEGCALNHYGSDSEEYGMPGWLIDTKADVDRFTDLVAALAAGDSR